MTYPCLSLPVLWLYSIRQILFKVEKVNRITLAMFSYMYLPTCQTYGALLITQADKISIHMRSMYHHNYHTAMPSLEAYEQVNLVHSGDAG